MSDQNDSPTADQDNNNQHAAALDEIHRYVTRLVGRELGLHEKGTLDALVKIAVYTVLAKEGSRS